ncbi:MAG: fatty acyl-AMP ligase, partial [Alphaproteobacteria bacterium]|nr:fatty acyl-AMP ligase [Alphaproteobacteria bacterium]
GMKGERALLLYPPGLDYVAAFFGCLYAGVIAVPAYPPRFNRSLSRLLVIVRDAQAAVALTDSRIYSRVSQQIKDTPELSSLDWLVTDEASGNDAGRMEVSGENGFDISDTINSDTLAFLQYTSGSTASPKGIMLTHNNLLHNIDRIEQCLGAMNDSQAMMAWLPPYHDMGLIGGILHPLYSGYPVILMSPLDFLQRPIRWLQAISHYRCTISPAPNFAYDLCV